MANFDKEIIRNMLQMVSRREDHSLGHHADHSASLGGKGGKQPFGGSSSGSSSMQSGGQTSLSKPVSSSGSASASASSAAQQQQQQYFKPAPVFLTANPKSKEAAYAWFRQLAANEPLAKLAKKIPVFNKKAENLPEILITLYEYRVPISRAVWYLKIMVLAQATSMNEVQLKILY
jgi:hypothetical protein